MWPTCSAACKSKVCAVNLQRSEERKYFITSFGKKVYNAQDLRAVQNSSKLKANDSIETTEYPAAELTRFVDTLIQNTEIKEILLKPPTQQL